MSSDHPMSPETLLAQAMHYLEPENGGIVPSVHMATTYARDQDYELRAPGISYGRDKNPTFLIAERLLAELEGAAGALLFSSGLAAAAALFNTLKAGDHVVAPTIMYHGLRDWLIRFCAIAWRLASPRGPRASAWRSQSNACARRSDRRYGPARRER